MTAIIGQLRNAGFEGVCGIDNSRKFHCADVKFEKLPVVGACWAPFRVIDAVALIVLNALGLVLHGADGIKASLHALAWKIDGSDAKRLAQAQDLAKEHFGAAWDDIKAIAYNILMLGVDIPLSATPGVGYLYLSWQDGSYQKWGSKSEEEFKSV